MENLYIKRIKARKWAWWVKALVFLLCSVIYFWIADLLTLIIYQFVEYGFTTRNTHRIYRFLLNVKQNPLNVFGAYSFWVKALWNAHNPHWTMFIPLLSPALFLVFLFKAYMSSQSSFNLWYRLNHRMAKREDVQNMPINAGQSIFLGRFEGKIVSPDAPSSVLVWGGDGLGKTSTVAVPSILMSNLSSVVAIDTTGDLMKFTSGHRFGLGRVFCFDWDKIDNPLKNEFWPRWNPLSDKDMPAKSQKRELYLRRLAEHLLPDVEDLYWRRLSNLACEALLNFSVAKVEQACANDYLLANLIDRGQFSAEDKDILLSYYAVMPQNVAQSAIDDLAAGRTQVENYLPIGSWNGIPEPWKGKELCLPMIYDLLLLQNLRSIKNPQVDVWAAFLQSMLKETLLFGYGAAIVDMVQELLGLAFETRKKLFDGIVAHMDMFRQASIRERCSSSDFSLKYARAMRKDSGEWCPCTVYLSAQNPFAANMSRLMLDMLIERNLEKHKSAQKMRLLFVIDDWNNLPPFSSLERGLKFGAEKNISFLLLTNNLKDVSEAYGKSAVEVLQASCDHKLLFAKNNVELSQQFRELAVFGSKSVQIPMVKTSTFSKVKKGVADAYYYRKIADELVALRTYKNITNSQHWLLIRGFYNLPIKVDAERFNLDARFNLLSLKKPMLFLDADLVKARNAQDVDVPPLPDGDFYHAEFDENTLAEDAVTEGEEQGVVEDFSEDQDIAESDDVQSNNIVEVDDDDVNVDNGVVENNNVDDNVVETRDVAQNPDDKVHFAFVARNDETEVNDKETFDEINVDENQTADVLSDDVDEEKRKDDDDWWLSDDAFRANDTEENPFENDKKLS